MTDKEREIWVGESRFFLGEDNILYETIVGNVDEKIVIEMKEASSKLMNKAEGKLNVLIDINKTGKPSKEARNIFKELMENERWGKVAIFGMHPVARAALGTPAERDKNKDDFPEME